MAMTAIDVLASADLRDQMWHALRLSLPRPESP
jgi:hypothetical protein